MVLIRKFYHTSLSKRELHSFISTVKMPAKYLGKVTHFKGKRLFDILCRLKNFGEGRIVYRNVFNERYPEPSYYTISRVEPDMKDPTLKIPSEVMKGKAFGQKVFRGEPLGEKMIATAYKSDWRLVPKAEEKQFFEYKHVESAINIIPDVVSLPPLMEHFITEDLKKRGKSVNDIQGLKINIRRGANNRAKLDGQIN